MKTSSNTITTAIVVYGSNWTQIGKFLNSQTNFVSTTVPAPFSTVKIVFSFPLSDLATMRNQLKNKAGIYCIILIDPRDGKPKFYVGSSKDIFVRLLQHKNPTFWRGKSKLYYSLNKYGINSFLVLILDVVDPIPSPLSSVLLQLEQYYFDVYHPTLNILAVAGTTLGHPVSAETRAKISKALKNRPISAETIAAIKANQPANRAVIVNDTIAVKQSTFYSLREASRALSVSTSTIWNAINKGKLVKGQYLIQYAKPIK